MTICFLQEARFSAVEEGCYGATLAEAIESVDAEQLRLTGKQGTPPWSACLPPPALASWTAASAAEHGSV